MNDAKVMHLFQMFAMIPDAEPWRDLAEAEMDAVKAELRDGADDSDNRLAFYTAARANLQYRRTVAQNTPVYAGTVPQDAECSLAERLVRAYRAECAPLLRDDAVTFLRTGGCT
jgi:hypothetical protein